MLTRFVCAIFLMGPSLCWAFPEMVRHGYSQCTACHFSASGGGILTAYGRQLSAELMSRWSYKGEEQVLHGAVGDAGAEKGIFFGGDVRSIQIHHEDAKQRDGRFFLMQSQAEVAYQKQNLLAVMSVGEIERPMDNPIRGNFHSPQYYAQAQITDEMSIRAGRFLPNYGLKMPDHTLIARSYLGLLPYIKRDTIEANYLGEKWSATLGATRTAEGTSPTQQARANFATGAYAFAERYKVGMSYWEGEKNSKDHNMQSLFAMLGWTHKFFTLAELDRQEIQGRVSRLGMTRVGYELTRGFVPYFQVQALDTNTKVPKSKTYYYSAGFQIFPRPHFEIGGQWTRVNGPKQSSDEAYLLIHYYL